MVFSGLTFLCFFLPGTIVLYFALPGRLRNAVLLLASMVFYFYGEQLYLLLMLGEIALAWGSACLIEKLQGKRGCRIVLILFLVLSLGMLGLFKFSDFLIRTVNGLGGLSLSSLGLALPIGISFYTFQAISYGIDVYRGEIPAQKNPFRLAVWLSFFPQLIAGPIVRFEEMAPALTERKETPEDFAAGALRFTVGLAKKTLLADGLYAFCERCEQVGQPTAALAWLSALAFLLYVYLDFSAYSDMAVGLGRLFGFHLPENFRYPLCSRSVRDFWRRWHITLGRWFRDYLYIPLGGSRCSMGHWLLNLLLVWALTGLWHGASWNFVLWGLWFGLLSVLERLWEKHVPVKLPKAVQHGYLLFAAILGFVFFRFTETGGWTVAFAQMFGGAPLWSAESAFWAGSYAVTLIVSLLAATPMPAKLSAKLMQKLDSRSAALGFLLRLLFMLLLLLFSAAHLADGTFSPFLYFRF